MYINRRTFIKGAMGVGVAAVASSAFLIKNKSPEEVAEMIDNVTETNADVLVVGGGIAGVFAAIRAKRNGANVTLVDKGSVGRSGQTPFANGFRVFDEANGDDRETWIKDWNTVTGGIHHSEYLDNFLDYSLECFEEMESWGATDVGFGAVLRSQVQSEGITLVERTMLTTLLEQNGQVAGAVGFNLDTEEAFVFNASAVILCTGAGAFKPNGFQVRSITSDGDAMAYRIGGQISGKEYVDTHGCNSETPAYCWGSWQRNWSSGVSKKTGGPEVDGRGLDLSKSLMAHEGNIGGSSEGGGRPGGESEDEERGGPPQDGERPEGAPQDGERPEGDSKGGGRSEGGGKPGTDNSNGGFEIGGASAGLSVHKAEGLFPADGKCGTNIKGLFAAGDCLSSMLAGAKYCGVNGTALAASATQGALAGETAAEFVKSNNKITISDDIINSAKEEMFAPRGLTEGFDPEWVAEMLRFNVIPYYVLYVKKEDRLQAALNNVMYLKETYAYRMIASDAHELRLVHETRNMLLNAEMKLRASLFRTESRGNHYREDYLDQNDNDWLAWVVIEKDNNGDMSLSKVSAS